jgi:hypothetical protein
MSIHDSSVNFHNLIRDLAEMYPYDVSEVVLVEIIANALDSKANNIVINYNQQEKILSISDDGQGMDQSQFGKYHDFAASLKTRGDGIGFAGVGAKISFNIAEKVTTETRSSSFEGGSNWYLDTTGKLVWEDLSVKNISEKGTRVEVHFNKGSSVVYSSTDDIVKLLYKHYLPLFETNFLNLYSKLGYYDNNLTFSVNKTPVSKVNLTRQFELNQVEEIIPEVNKQKKGFGIIGLAMNEYPLGDYVSGLLVCTHGKVIKSELFNQFPGEYGARIFGLVEVPTLINYLTANKTDFIRKRSDIKKFEQLYSSIREPFKAWLKKLGVYQAEEIANNDVRILEKEIKKIIEKIPEFSDFFGFRNPKKVLSPNIIGSIDANQTNGSDPSYPIGVGSGSKLNKPIIDVGTDGRSAYEQSDEQNKIKTDPISRIGNRGPKIQLMKRGDKQEVAWVEGNTIVINIAHPGYTKISSNKIAKTLFYIVAIAEAIQKHIISSSDVTSTNTDLSLIDRVVTAWGNV